MYSCRCSRFASLHFCAEQIERDLVKEGEKLSDMLSMPVKNAMGVVLNVDYEADIVNVSEILEMTKARCQLFCDSVELQRLTLQQVSYVLNYETDASQVLKLYKYILIYFNFYPELSYLEYGSVRSEDFNEIMFIKYCLFPLQSRCRSVILFIKLICK